MQSEAQEFHKWAKDAGNKLRAYVLSYASGATAAALCLVELHVDARRCFYIAKQLVGFLILRIA
jgi:hypothetical protein